MESVIEFALIGSETANKMKVMVCVETMEAKIWRDECVCIYRVYVLHVPCKC